MWLPAIGAGVSGLLVLIILFYKDLKVSYEGSSNSYELKDKPLTFITLFMMILTLILLAIANFIKIELYLIVLLMAMSLTVLSFILFIC
ncbi:MAG: hypothetical protein ACOX02_00500 [Acholeplasmatales bacterium]